ncbi:MAG: lipocalin family protein [Methylovulum sp.]|jgi:apolipoprotein D and lipocalin family protein
MRLIFFGLSFLLGGCAPVKLPLPLVKQVDLQKFMGDWYVIANIPTFIEKGAHNAVESYRLNPDGRIATTFTFRANGFQGSLKRYKPTGYVIDTNSNAVWAMEFIWPFKADYRISFLKPDYSLTVIGREARDYVWIMARTPQIPEADYQALVKFLAENGYDVNKLQKVPQRWQTPSQPLTTELN